MASLNTYKSKCYKKAHLQTFSLICLLLSFLFQPISAQVQNLHFHRLSSDDGLPQHTVNCIIQDKRGFMWFGTQDGLARYDGYSFKTYRSEPGNPNSLSNNYIWDIHEDSLGIFWISSFGGGLTRFDPAAETFKHFKREENNENSLSNNNTFQSISTGNEVWVCTNDGVSLVNTLNGDVKRLYTKPGTGDGHAGNFTGAIAREKSGIVWIGSDEGLIRHSPDGKNHDIFPETPFGENMQLQTIRELRIIDNKLFIITTDAFLNIDFDREITNVLLKSSQVDSSGQITFQNVHPALVGNFWIGTNKGLLQYNPESGNYYKYGSEDDNEKGQLSQNSILSLCRSDDGVFWIGSQNGVGILYREKSQFQLIRKNPAKNNTLSSNQIKGIIDDNDGLVWIATVDGLNVWERQSDRFTVFRNKPGNSNSISSDYLLSLLMDDNDDLWIGTRQGGVNKLIRTPGQKLSSGQFIQYGPKGASIQHMMDDGEYLWLGSSGQGLIRMHKETGETKKYIGEPDGCSPSHPYVFYVFKDSRQNFWLGTATGGLNLFDEESEQFVYLTNNKSNSNSLSNNLILCIFEDSKNRLWIGTASGLNRFKPSIKQDVFGMLQNMEDLGGADLFQTYGRFEGLPNDVVYGIQEDGDGFLWLSTNNGLAKFDPEKGSVEKVFDMMDGLQNNEHNQNAFFTNDQGVMYFGGVGGLNIFHPEKLEKNTYKPPVVITDIKLYNVSVPLKSVAQTNDPDLTLEATPPSLTQLNLDYHHDVISFDFAALSYINPDKNQYRYKLEGFDRQWIDDAGNRTATYTNLDAGDYTFRVIASNNDGIWNEEGATLQLSVSPAPWQTWYAYLAYASIIAFALYYFIRQRIYLATRELQMQQKIEKIKSEERALFRKKSAQDFHDEAGNKITRINLYNELARSEAGDNQELQKYLGNIQKTTRELSSGTRDFIWVIDPEKDTLFETILRIKDFGESMFGDSETAFHVKGLRESFRETRLSMDTRRAMLLIFKEAMNNCAKYALATDVTLTVSLSGTALQITLQDNGRGFDPENPEHQKGYGTGIMKERAQKISANLAIQSKHLEGTRVTLKYEITQMGDSRIK